MASTLKNTTTTDPRIFCELPVKHKDPNLAGMFGGYHQPTTKVWLVGGAARSLYSGEPVNDYDFVFGNIDSLNTFVSHLRNLGAKKVSETIDVTDRITCEDFVLVWSDDSHSYIQIKHEFYHHPCDQFNTVDFTICQFAKMFGDSDQFVATVDGVNDFENKHLRIHKLYWPIATMARIPKFINLGYTPFRSNTEFYGGIIATVKQIPDNHIAFAPRTKKYVKSWKEKFGV